MRLDVDALTRLVAAALPDATPDVVAALFLAQIPHVDPQMGASIVDRVAANLPASTWLFEDDRLDRWPEPVAERALVHIRALPPGKQRILALCYAAKHLTADERREAYDGILDETLPRVDWDYAKPRGHGPTIAYLIHTLPEDLQEAWIHHQSVDADGNRDESGEYRARRETDRFTETVVRELWARIDHTPTGSRDVPPEYRSLIPHLPNDLRLQALERIRASASRSTRLHHHLVDFDDELTDAERIEVVEHPWDLFKGEHFAVRASRIRKLHKHLAKVSVELRRKWLEVVLSCCEESNCVPALLALLPYLSGEDLRRAEDAIVKDVLREGGFSSVEERWDLLPEAELAPLLLRLKADAYGWHRDGLIKHVIQARNPELADRCLQPLVDALAELEADSRLEIVCAVTPWLADRSEGAMPRAFAELEVPSSDKPGNPQYFIERVFKSMEDTTPSD